MDSKVTSKKELPSSGGSGGKMYLTLLDLEVVFCPENSTSG